MTLKKEAVHFFETAVNFQQTAWNCIPEDGLGHSHRYGNLGFKVNSVCVQINGIILAVPVIVHWSHCLY
jgi:hypothetical protein